MVTRMSDKMLRKLVFRLSLEGLKFKEVAERCGITEDEVEAAIKSYQQDVVDKPQNKDAQSST
jgi:DNA-directed RNA polymerase specialized sigma24 family protein